MEYPASPLYFDAVELNMNNLRYALLQREIIHFVVSLSAALCLCL